VIGKWLVLGEEKKRNYKAVEAAAAKSVPYWQTKFERIEQASTVPEA